MLLGLASTAQGDSYNPIEVKDSKLLNKGYYLVTVESKDHCYDDEINLLKEVEYADGNPGGKLIVKLSAGEIVASNLMRPAVCMIGGVQTGKVMLKLAGDTEVQTIAPLQSPDLKIKKIEEVSSFGESHAVGGSQITLNPGKYSVELHGPGSCYSQEINIKKSLEYDRNGGMMIKLEPSAPVFDNLIRPAVCYRHAINNGKVLLDIQ